MVARTSGIQMGAEFLLHGVVSGHGHPVARLSMWRNDADNPGLNIYRHGNIKLV